MMMPLIFRYKLLLLPVSLLAAACSKSVAPPGTASITVINAIAGAPSLEVTNMITSEPLAYNISRKYSIAGDAFLFKPYLRDDMTLTLDSPAIFDLSLPLPIGSTSSLFLTGTIDSYDTLFVKDDPVRFDSKDSSIGIRFVNLSAGSAPISINLQDQAYGSEVGKLPYRSITAFKIYQANATVSSYMFEFRDLASNDVLATYTIDNINNPGSDNAPNLWRNKNITMVFDGLPGAGQEWPQTVFVVNNY